MAETTGSKPLLCVLIVIAFAASCSSPKPADVYAAIRKESQQASFAKAAVAAKREYLRSLTQPNAIWRWKFQLLYAEMLLFNSETTEAKALIRQEPPFAELQPRRNWLLGYVAYREGDDHSHAESIVRKAAEDAAKVGDFECEADAWLTVASYASSDEEAVMRQVIDRIVVIGKQHSVPNQLAGAYVDYGMLRIRQSRFGEAIPFFQKASDAAGAARASLLQSIAIGDLAICYYNIGDFARSIELRKQAIDVQKAAGLIPALRDSYLELGLSQSLQGDTAHAVESLRSAFSLTNPDDSAEYYALVGSNLASVLAGAGAIDEAERLNSKISGVIKPEFAESKGLLLANRASILRSRGALDPAIAAYKEAIGISTDYPSQLWSTSAALASIYAEKGEFESARKYFELALHTIEVSRANQAGSDYQIRFLSQLIVFYQNYVEFLMTHGDVRGALNIADSSRAAVLAHNLNVGDSRNAAATVSRVLELSKQSRQTFLFYWLAPKRSYLWVISQGHLDWVPLAESGLISGKVKAYRNLLEREKLDPAAASSNVPQQLFQMLVQPALQWIPSGSEVVIIPDDVLHGLNFETLMVPTPSPHYWLQEATLSVAPSLGLLTKEAGEKKAPSLLVIGDPDYTGTGMAQLDTAESEIDHLIEHFGAQHSRVERQKDAVPSAYRAAEPYRFSAIHFAAHAEANEQNPLDSAILLSKEDDNFRLYAHEIAATPLTADLVTLSACRSAGARSFTGEGMVGFAWAFFQAGARNVVAGLWDVNDRSTADLMQAFYTNVHVGLPYAQALRKAKLSLLSTEFRKPYYWAPFQLYSRSVNQSRNTMREKNASSPARPH